MIKQSKFLKQRKIKIAHIVWDLNIGGLETLVVNLASKLDRERFECIIICLKEKGALAELSVNFGIPVFSLNKKLKFEFITFFKLAKLLLIERVQIVHSHNFGAYIYGCVAAICAGFKKVIYTEHGRIFPDKSRRMLAEKILSYFTYKIVAVSKHMKQSLIKYERINSNKISVIYNGVDLNIFENKKHDNEAFRNKMKNAFGINVNELVIGQVARLAKVKDQATLLNAFALFTKNLTRKSAKLLIVGDGPEHDNLIELSRRLDIEHLICFAGMRKEIAEILNIIDVFVLTSINEGISLTLLEAIACGVPVVATSVGGNPEIVQDGVNGFLAKEKDPEHIAFCIEKAISLKPPGLDNIFSLSHLIKEYEFLYSGIKSGI